VEEEKSGGEKGEGDGNGEGSQVEPQGSSQLRPLSYWNRQLTSLATHSGH